MTGFTSCVAGSARAPLPRGPRYQTHSSCTWGSIFNRRNLPTLVRAFAKVREVTAGVRLAVVGDDRTYPKEDLPSLLEATGTKGVVDLLSYVSESELDALYGRARVFAFLSEYEGFGSHRWRPCLPGCRW